MRSPGTLAELKARFSVNDDIEVVLSRDAGNRGELEALPGVLALENTGAASFFPILLGLEPAWLYSLAIGASLSVLLLAVSVAVFNRKQF